MYTGSSIRCDVYPEQSRFTHIHAYIRTSRWAPSKPMIHIHTCMYVDKHTARSVKHCEEIITHGSLGWKSRDWTPHAARVTVGDAPTYRQELPEIACRADHMLSRYQTRRLQDEKRILSRKIYLFVAYQIQRAISIGWHFRDLDILSALSPFSAPLRYIPNEPTLPSPSCQGGKKRQSRTHY